MFPSRHRQTVKPAVEVKSRRVGGSTYQGAGRGAPGPATSLAIAVVIGPPAGGPSGAWRYWPRVARRREQPRHGGEKREDTHKMAEANKAFAHYRW